MQIKESNIIYENPLPQLCSKQSFFPSLCQLTDGTIASSVVIGQAFESVDSANYITFSHDGGKTWSEPKPMFDTYKKPLTDYCKITALDGNRIVAMGYTYLRDNPELPIGNPENGGLLDDFVFYALSEDGGMTWSDMKKIECSWGPHVEASAPITVLKDGTWITPITGFPDWEGKMHGTLCGRALCSHDEGKTWNDNAVCMDFGNNQITCYEQRMCQLDPKTFATCMEDNCMDMRYEYLAKECNFRDDSEAEWFVNRFGLKGKAETVSDMADKVDIGFIQSCNWEKHLEQAMPFIEKGKPVFIDKPVVGSVKDIEKLRELTKSGAKIYGSSSLRYCKEIREFVSKGKEEHGDILGIYATCGVDEFNYAIHIAEAFSAICDCNAVSGKFLGSSVAENGKTVEMYSMEFENGVKGVFHLALGEWIPFSITIMTTKGNVTMTPGGSEMYSALLKEIYRMMKGKPNHLCDTETLINCTQAMLCCKKSKEEFGGKDVTIDMLEAEDKFDGYKFEEKYGATAKVLYKD